MGKQLFGQIGRLKKEKTEEYKRLHQVDVYTEKWAGVLSMIRDCNIRNYAIFIKDDLVFAYFEYIGDDYEADIKKMADDPTTQEWWTHTRPCFTRYSEDSPDEFYQDMLQIFDFKGTEPEH